MVWSKRESPLELYSDRTVEDNENESEPRGALRGIIRKKTFTMKYLPWLRTVVSKLSEWAPDNAGKASCYLKQT